MALSTIGVEHRILHWGEQVHEVDSLLLPGVGSFRQAMIKLQSAGFVHAIQNAANDGKPTLGICLGMQLLFESSEELGHTEGLGILSGKVVKSLRAHSHGPSLGWEYVGFEKEIFTKNYSKRRLFTSDLNLDGDYYFAHSYEAQISGDTQILCSSSRESGILVAGVQSKSVRGIQFHPEKSGEAGLGLLRKLLSTP
jgi:glutamine amidotransferase